MRDVPEKLGRCPGSSFSLLKVQGVCSCQNDDMSRYRVVITLKPTLLDPGGRTVGESLRALGFSSVRDVRIGKVIELELSNGSTEEVQEMCRQLLVNPVTETYEIQENA